MAFCYHAIVSTLILDYVVLTQINVRLVGPNFLSGVSMRWWYIGADTFTSQPISELSATLLLRILLSLAQLRS